MIYHHSFIEGSNKSYFLLVDPCESAPARGYAIHVEEEQLMNKTRRAFQYDHERNVSLVVMSVGKRVSDLVDWVRKKRLSQT